MKITSALVLTSALAALAPRPSLAVHLTGAGSTFVYPLVAKWATAYRAVSGHVVNYQSIGSGGGIKQIENRTVDFGATDMPLGADDLAKKELAQFPVVAGAVVPVVHVRGVPDGALKLTGLALADIYLGKIKRWNDPRLVELNPDLSLPDRLITVVHRADGSGTSFIWTSFLSAASAEWRTRVGRATALKWPVGVGAKGNEGVASFVKQIDGSVGYVESAFAARARMTTARLENRAGRFVSAEPASFRAALANVDWAAAPAFDVSLVNAPGEVSWPVTGATFILMRRRPTDAAATRAALQFFTWAFQHGGPAAEALHYVPLPEHLQRRVAAAWSTQIGL